MQIEKGLLISFSVNSKRFRKMLGMCYFGARRKGVQVGCPNWSPEANLATGPLNQGTGPPQTDAGVGIGMLISDRDSFTWK